MANKEDRVLLEQLEKEAYQLSSKGNILVALEILDKAIEIEKRWYHLYIKASWLYYWPEKNIDEISNLIQEGFSRFPDQRFWFYFIRAHVRRYEVVRLAATSQQNIELSLSQSLEAQKDINSAISEIRERPQIIQATLNNPPIFVALVFSWDSMIELHKSVNDLRLEITSVNQMISMAKYVFDAENRTNRRIDKQEANMQSEKMRTIELLGFFTAIIAFIILLGNAAFKTTYNEAMPILGGLSLVLILFVTVAGLITSKFYRYRDILKDVRSWLAFSLIIILALLVWFSQREQQNPDAPSTNGIQSQAIVEVLDKEEMN